MKRPLLLSLSSALLLSLSLPPFKTGFLAYFALVPLLVLLGEAGGRYAFRWGYLTGLFVSIGTVYWIVFPTPAGAIATILVHPLFYAAFSLAYVTLRKNFGLRALISVPFLWTAVEYVKSLGELAFPWVTIGYSQSYYPALIQYASVTGVYGVSFWIACLNCLVMALLQAASDTKYRLVYSGAFVAFLMVPFVQGQVVLSKARGTSPSLVRIGLVQGNIDPYLKWDKELKEMNFAAYERLSRKIGRGQVDLIIWPETATPTYLLHDRASLARVWSLVGELDTPILTGTPDYIRLAEGSYKTFNSVVLLDGQAAPIQKYDKMHLVPFGERVPYEDSFAIVKKLLSRFEMGEGNFSPGEAEKVFTFRTREVPNDGESRRVALGSVICFESAFPALVARFVERGAQLLVVVTNDGWFGRTVAPFQHAQMAVFRAIENRRSVARSANTGVSMTIDPYGGVRRQSGIFREAVFTDSLPIESGLTFYTTHRDWFARGFLLIAVLMLIFGPLTSRRRQRGLQ